MIKHIILVLYLLNQFPESKSSSDNCRFNEAANLTYQFITSPQWPNTYPNDQNCYWTITGIPTYGIEISFININLEEDHDFIYLYAGEEELFQFTGTIEVRPFIINSSYAAILFVSDLSNPKFYSGFQVKYKVTLLNETSNNILVVPCQFEEHATLQPQYITSPYHPNEYFQDLTCNWTIFARPGSNIVLQFLHVEIENIYDSLEIIENSGSITEINGSDISNPYIFTSFQLSIVFTTDEADEYSGFRIAYSLLCQFQEYATTQPQYITSPNWPDSYANNLYCSWTIDGPPGSNITLRVLELELEENFDFLKIVVNKGEQLLSKGNLSQQFTINASEVNLLFTTDVNTQYSGFRLEFFILSEPEIDIETITTATSTKQTQKGSSSSTKIASTGYTIFFILIYSFMKQLEMVYYV